MPQSSNETTPPQRVSQWVSFAISSEINKISRFRVSEVCLKTECASSSRGGTVRSTRPSELHGRYPDEVAKLCLETSCGSRACLCVPGSEKPRPRLYRSLLTAQYFTNVGSVPGKSLALIGTAEVLSVDRNCGGGRSRKKGSAL